MVTTRTGRRLLVAPSRARQLGICFVGGLFVPAVVVGPMALMAMVVGVVTSTSFLVTAGIVLLVLAGISGVLLGAGLGYVTVVTLVRWVEFRPRGIPKRIVVARMGRKLTIAVADLERIAVVERFTLGTRRSITVVLHSHGERVECEAGLYTPLSNVQAQAVVERLGKILEPAGIPVGYEAILVRSNSLVENWWPAQKVAAFWQIPPTAVPDTAKLWNVRSMYSPRNLSLLLYDPDDVCEVAERVQAGPTPMQATTAQPAATRHAQDALPETPELSQ